MERLACCAGSWYPADATALAEQVDGFLASDARPKLVGKPVAIIAPHAGYRYSAPVAGEAYGCLGEHRYRRVVVLAFSHSRAGSYRGVDVPRKLDAYRTPLGDVPIDRAVCDAMLSHGLFTCDPGMDQDEHSLELQLPFLQRQLGAFQLVPLYLGGLDDQDYPALAEAIRPWLDDETLLVASSDFTHFGPRFGYEPFRDQIEKNLCELADRAAAPLLTCDFDGFLAHVNETGDTICGRGPIALLLRVLSMTGGATGVRVGYDTSGHLTGDWSNSVTYQSLVFTRPAQMLDAANRRWLLDLARGCVKATVSGQSPSVVDPDSLPRERLEVGACFVTLKNAGRLRGCVGNMAATEPLYAAVVRNAVLACGDRRFERDPITTEEVASLHIEISYLSPMIRVGRPEDVVVGRDGLMICLGDRRGVLLPQVAAERGWTRDAFLSQTCRKAGLDPDAWKRPKAELFIFRAEVFGE